ncbi:MAG: SDR family NAD(P)-dependent oxidoreductase [Actinomycetales bacterium]|nr:SDR family NAD(P)-dependent oxidoreductase [Actinomycetales bacterium]
MNTTGRFQGMTAIVTGAGSGIGKATAISLGQQGARVVAGDVSPDRLDALIAEQPALNLVAIAGDVSVQAEVDALVAAAGDRVHALANVAGVMDGFLPAAEVDDDTWHRVIEVNLTSMMRLTRAVLPGMIAAGGGAIVNVSSEASFRGSCAGVAYTASKHAVNGLTRSVAACYRGNGIRCNAVAPGGVRTNVDGSFRSAHAGQALGPLLQAIVPTPAQPEEIAAVIVHLLSEDARNMNGAIVPCDGGWSAL